MKYFYVIVCFLLFSCDDKNELAIPSPQSKVNALDSFQQNIKTNSFAFEELFEKHKKSTSPQISGELESVLSLLTVDALKVLDSYGISYNDISGIVSGEDDCKIILFSMILIELEQNGVSYDRFYVSPNRKTSWTQTRSKMLDCAARSVFGIGISEGIYAAGAKIGLNTALRIFGTVAVRTIGVVGVAYSVALYGDCMGWYQMTIRTSLPPELPTMSVGIGELEYKGDELNGLSFISTTKQK